MTKERKKRKRPEFKIVGVLTEIESKKIHINLDFPYTDLNYEYKDVPNKLIGLDKRLTRELMGIAHDEEIENIKFCKPFYYKFHRSDTTTRDMFVKLSAPKRYLHLYDVGSIVEIIASIKTYNFNDPHNKTQKIRGWGMNIKYMKLLPIKH